METHESIEAIGRAVDKLITDVHALKNSNPTLRDQFAMSALAGLLANSYSDGHSQPMCTAPSEEFARWAYNQADAMMEARKHNKSV